MSLPLPVRIIRNALQQKVVPLLDLTDAHVAGADPDEPKVLTRALAAVALWEHARGISLEEAAAAVVDGEGDGGIDAIHISTSEKRIYVVQSKWKNPGTATIDDNAINKLGRGIYQLTNPEEGTKYLNQRVKALSGRFTQMQLDPDHKTIIIIALLGDHPVHHHQRDGLAAIGKRHAEEFFEYRYMHLADFRRITRDGITRQTMTLEANLTESFHHEAQHGGDGEVIDPEAYIGTVRANEVFEWVDACGEQLFEQNIRSSLGSTSVNEKIRTTLQKRPTMFWTLNRGITMVADRIRPTVANSGSYSAPIRLVLPGASIVDGAQTATSVHRVLAAAQGRNKRSDAKIPIRIISLEGASPDLARQITFAANTQNAILQRDFAAGDDAQEELQFELDQLGKRYVYRRNEELVLSSADTCRIEEVAPALVCLQSDARLIGRIKADPDALWEQVDGGVYRSIFHPVQDARKVWNATVFLRGVLAETETEAGRREGRARSFAQNGDWLICHILLRLLDAATIRDAAEAEWAEVIIASRRKFGTVLDLLIHHTDTKYGTDAYPESTFKDERRCKILADLVLTDLRAGNAPVLRPTDRKRERSRNAVELIQDAGLLEDETILRFQSPTKLRREQIEAWIQANPELARVRWTSHRRQPLRWEGDGKQHAPSPLAQDIIEEIMGRKPKSVRGPDCWVTADGRTLTQLAEEAKRRVADNAV